MENQEVINYLLAHNDLKIIQRKDMFNFSLDTVLLSQFCTINKDVKNIVDFGTNNAAIPLLLSKRTLKKIIGIEIQDEAVDLARRNVEMNDLNDQIEIVHGDIKDVVKELPKAQLIVCNPPFFEVGENSNLNDNEYLTIARHEIKIDLEGIISAAAYLLDNKGRFAIVHRPDRMIDILNIMQKYDIEPKRIRFVYPKMNRDSHVLLVEGMYKGKKGLKIEPPLYAHNDDGSYSNEVRRMFGEMNRQKSFENERPTLYLVATPIGNLDEMTYRSINTLKNVKYIAAEDTRNTVKLLNHFEISTKLISHHEHNIKQSIPKLIQLLEEGNDIALVSDAGYPAISDPGYELVKEAIEHEINVVPISGCNACLDALVVSGIAPQPFMFYGFLDHLDKKKKKELIDLKKYKETIVFYESPHRIKKTLNLMLDILGDRNIALCREITKKHEEIIRGHISEIISIVEELKGEMVIVVEGSQEVEEEITFETTINEDVDMYIEKGMSTKDAIKEVAKQRNLNKNSVYQEYHSK